MVALLLVAGADKQKMNQGGRNPMQDSRKDVLRVYTLFQQKGKKRKKQSNKKINSKKVKKTKKEKKNQ